MIQYICDFNDKKGEMHEKIISQSSAEPMEVIIVDVYQNIDHLLNGSNTSNNDIAPTTFIIEF